MAHKRFGNFDGGEIRFVAENMDCHTRVYVEAARQAALRRARSSRLNRGARKEFASLAEKMKHALETWPRGKFDSAVDCLDRRYESLSA